MKLQMSAFSIIVILLALTFAGIGVTISLINYNFQVSNEQRIELLTMTEALHKSDSLVTNQTDKYIKQIIWEIQRDAFLSRNGTEVIADLIIQNQNLIKNTTGTNLNHTFINQNNIQEILHHSKNLEIKLDKLLNVTK